MDWLSGLSSEAEATLYGAIIAGTFALLGVVIERVLRLTGRLRCYSSGWKAEFVIFRTDGSHAPVERPEDATHVRYRFAIDLFNGIEAPTGLRDVCVVLVRDDGKRFPSQPYDLARMRR